MKEYKLKKVSIYIGDDVLESLPGNLSAGVYSSTFVLVDENTSRYSLPIIQKYLTNFTVITVKCGEQHKTLETAGFVWNELEKHRANRNSVLLNVGGGMICDLGGFCAANYKRGIDFMHIPTTLLAMVDAAIGGKVAVDFNSIKNMIGLFQNPASIYINPEFLHTLPSNELINGYAEVIKHTLLSKRSKWEKLKSLDILQVKDFSTMIFDNVKVKGKVVKKDPKEKSIRKILNLGHTIGHAIEAYSMEHDSKPIKHGEAVAAGIVCELFLSREILGFSNDDLKTISAYILKTFPKYSLQSVMSHEIIQYMYHDKKNTTQGINFTLLSEIGKPIIDNECTEHQVARALNYYDSL